MENNPIHPVKTTSEVKSSIIDAFYIGNYKSQIGLPFHVDNCYLHLRCFTNAINAINWIKANSKMPQIIFCESELSGTNSIELLSYFKKESKKPLAFYFICLNQPSESFIQEALNAKADELFELPLKDGIVYEKIKLFINKKNNSDSNKDDKTDKNDHLKRGFDIILSALALIALSPLLLLFAVLIKIDSKGPVFFISKRVGQGYKVFDFYKFRSMKTGAEHLIDKLKDQNQYAQNNNEEKANGCEECKKLKHPCSTILHIDGKEICENFHNRSRLENKASFIKFKNDPRVTPLGQFLRKSSIDELPQLINILKGDMSFVGNRPLPVYEAEQLTTDKWSLRFNAPAGLTGLWQVSKRGKSEMSETERKELDNTYALNHSFVGDLKLILRTIPALTQKENV
jgi:lipopolysaccharide/colanic/teichoic acid biosynthesis glycosyltransferase